MNRFGRVGIALALLAGVLLAGGVAEAAPSTTVKWKVSSLSKGQKTSLSTLVSTNSPGMKTWSRSGTCTLTPSKKPTTLTMGVKGSCTLTLKIAKSGKFVAKTSKKTITLATTVAPTTTTTVAPTTTTTVAPTTTTTVALTCAQGGSCTPGVDTGPGGGIVFYYSASAFTSAGSACNTNCHALEVAPSGWIVSASPASQTNCTRLGTTSADPQCEWSGNTSTLIGATAQGTAIGTGYANTSAIILQSNTAGKAATTARAYQGGGKTDWFLPSKDELNQLCRYAWNLTVANTDTTCTGMSGTIRTGFSTASYWSSSELDATNARAQSFGFGVQFDDRKFGALYVRPVRAF
jgi:hypothetical protein